MSWKMLSPATQHYFAVQTCRSHFTNVNQNLFRYLTRMRLYACRWINLNFANWRNDLHQFWNTHMCWVHNKTNVITSYDLVKINRIKQRKKCSNSSSHTKTSNNLANFVHFNSVPFVEHSVIFFIPSHRITKLRTRCTLLW